jgi:hypothetical protein
MKWFTVFGLAGLIGGAHIPLGQAAQPDCKLYKVTAPVLDVHKDAEKPGSYIDVLESGNIACVTKDKKIGDRMWGYVEHRLLDGGPVKPVRGWVGLRYMVLQPKGSDSATSGKKKSAAAAPKPARPPIAESDILKFDQPLPFGPFPVRGKTLKELAKWQPIFSPVKGLDENLWKKQCTTCHKWNRERLCDQGSSYIKSAKAVFRHQHPYGGPYKLALMRWAKTGCK